MLDLYAASGSDHITNHHKEMSSGISFYHYIPQIPEVQDPNTRQKDLCALDPDDTLVGHALIGAGHGDRARLLAGDLVAADGDVA